jgi:hypothetical protein
LNIISFLLSLFLSWLVYVNIIQLYNKYRVVLGHEEELTDEERLIRREEDALFASLSSKAPAVLKEMTDVLTKEDQDGDGCNDRADGNGDEALALDVVLPVVDGAPLDNNAAPLDNATPPLDTTTITQQQDSSSH